MQTKIAEAKSKIKVLSEENPLLATPSGTSTEYIPPTTAKKRQAKQRIYPEQGSSNRPGPTQSEIKSESQSSFPIQTKQMPIKSALKKTLKLIPNSSNNDPKLNDRTASETTSIFSTPTKGYLCFLRKPTSLQIIHEIF